MGFTALREASMRDLAPMVTLLLKNGADTSMQDNVGYTALADAAQYDRRAIVQALLEGGADPNIHNLSHRTALMQASQTWAAHTCLSATH
jgi:ankyrin repeat protein